MEDFIVRKQDSRDYDKWYMYIGFNDMPKHSNSLGYCYGSALVRIDDESEYWFNYSFHHSADWNEAKGITITSIKKNKLSSAQLIKIGKDILRNIKEFITKMN
jgi:hypothetical protein